MFVNKEGRPTPEDSKRRKLYVQIQKSALKDPPRNGVTWSQQAYLKASNTGADDFFGNGVAISGDSIVIGAPFEDSNATGSNGDQTQNSALDSGAAYIFNSSAPPWAIFRPGSGSRPATTSSSAASSSPAAPRRKCSCAPLVRRSRSPAGWPTRPSRFTTAPGLSWRLTIIGWMPLTARPSSIPGSRRRTILSRRFSPPSLRALTPRSCAGRTAAPGLASSRPMISITPSMRSWPTFPPAVSSRPATTS